MTTEMISRLILIRLQVDIRDSFVCMADYDLFGSEFLGTETWLECSKAHDLLHGAFFNRICFLRENFATFVDNFEIVFNSLKTTQQLECRVGRMNESHLCQMHKESAWWLSIFSSALLTCSQWFNATMLVNFSSGDNKEMSMHFHDHTRNDGKSVISTTVVKIIRKVPQKLIIFLGLTMSRNNDHAL